MRNIIKSSLFLLFCLCCSVGIAQNAFTPPNFGLSDKDGGCLVHGGVKEIHIVNKVRAENILGGFKITAYGDITAEWKPGMQDSIILIRAKTGAYGAGRVRVYADYQLDTNELCVKLGCVSPIGFMVEDLSVVQQFTNPEAIKGPDNVTKGKEVAFTIKPFLRDDYFSWTAPAYMNLLYGASDGSSQTFKVNDNAVFGASDSICVIAGQCPDNTPVCKALRPGTEMPEVEHDTLTCTDNVKFSFKVKSPKEGYKYWWKSTVASWSMKGAPTDMTLTTDTTTTWGVLTLYVSNNVDTTSQDFAIIKKITKPIELIGDTACIHKGDTLNYYLYPSPDVEVNWILPDGWHRDELNPNSSSVWFTIDGNASSGTVKVNTLVCGEQLDSVFISVQSTYDANKGIHTTEAVTCFTMGEDYEFYVDADPTVLSYEWIFPEAWGMPSQVVSNPMDTVMPVTIGETAGLITVKGTTCDGTWERTFAIEQFAPVAPTSIVLDGKSCVNSGLADTITLVAVGAKEVDFYTWNFPKMWTLLSTSDSTICLLTNENVTGSYDVSVSVGNGVCASDTTITTTIVQDGIGQPVTIEIANGPVPVLRLLKATPANMPKYAWYEYPDLVTPKALTNTRSIPLAGLSKIHCVKITGTNSCASMACTQPISITVDSVSRDSVTTTLTPPTDNVVQLTLELPDDGDDDEEDTPPAPQSTPKVDKPVVRKAPAVEPSFSFYPNPTQNNIYIQFSNGAADFIEIVNLMGVSMLKKRCPDGQMELNVSHLKRGIYIVKVTFGNKIVSDKLYIVK